MKKNNYNLYRRLGEGFLAATIAFFSQSAYSQNALINASPAQVRAAERHWIFGVGASLDFGLTGNASATSGNFGAHNFVNGEGFSTATDLNGNLLFYTSATQTYDRSGNATPNGAITGNNSATQGVVILPHLGNPDRYLTVYTSTDVGDGPNGNLLYSVFDINANGGNGDLVLKNQIPNPSSTPIIANEMITYAPNATGDGFWIISGINNGTCSTTSFACTSQELRIYAIEVTFPGGNAIQFSTPVISPAARLFNGYGSIEFNNDYSRALVLSSYFNGVNLFNKYGLLTEVDFNAATGAFTQRWTLNLPFLPGSQKYYYADYSSNGQFAFVNTVFGDGAYRYNLTSANAATIKSTETLITSPNPAIPFSGAVRTGPNGMTYFASRSGAGIWELTNPEIANVANFSFTPKSFTPGTGAFGLSQTTLGVAVDYGDAPESYGTNSSNNGPRHRILFNPLGENVLAIGATATSEPNGIPTANADGDVDDGVASFPAIAGGNLSQQIPSYSIQVAVVNETTTDATLSGWIDWNTNGAFDASEVATATIMPGMNSAILSWANQTLTGVAGTTGTFARFRISTDMGIQATGPATNGEVEDYHIPFSTPLPVKLVSFKVSKVENAAYLSWSTTQETNSDRFEIERCNDTFSWTKIAMKSSTGESSETVVYNYTDPFPNAGINYYRLKIVDRDSSFAYSRIQSIDLGAKTSIYPNPVSNVLKFKEYSRIKKITLYNSSGVKVIERHSLSEEGLEVRSLNSGIYSVNITMDNGSMTTQKVIIVK